ncbi:hypothetical protein Lser_V15G32945 [Lactuca serriola]
MADRFLGKLVYIDEYNNVCSQLNVPKSETGNILSEIIKSKFNHSITNKIQVDQSDTNVVNMPAALNEANNNEGTKTTHTEPLYTQETPTTPTVNPPVDIYLKSRQQNEELDELSASVEMIGFVGLTIHDELLSQEKIIEDLGSEMESTSNRLNFVQVIDGTRMDLTYK